MNREALATLVALATWSHAQSDSPGVRRPNVVLIVTDDQGLGDFSAAGNPAIETPHLDAMAQESVSVQPFYVSPVCSPTRASLMTGRYNQRTRCIDTWIGRSMMDPAEVTIAEVLRDAGYATGIFGKWHLGDCYPMRAIDQGFDEALVHRGGGLAQPSEPRENRRRYTDPVLLRDGRKVRTRGYCTGVFFAAARDFVRRAHRAGRPFFCYIATNAPHAPFHDVPADWLAHYRGKLADLSRLPVRLPADPRRRAAHLDRLARIAAMISDIDENVGRLLAFLRAEDLERDTIVVFTTDNGPNTARYTCGLRGAKGDVFEGGVRAPLWIRWKGHLPAGRVVRRIAAHVDVMPTLLDACGVRPPDGVRLDGRSVWPLVRGDAAAPWPPRSLVIQAHRGDRLVRYHHFVLRRGRYALVHPSGFGRERFSGEPRFELYDLEADPGQRHDVAAAHPEVVARLRADYDRWFDDVVGSRPEPFAPPRIQVGTAHEDPTVLTRQDWRGHGWGDKALGYWEIHVARAGHYELSVLVLEAPYERTLRLEVGGVRVERGVPARALEVPIEDLALPAGDARLSVRIESEHGVQGAWQVHVSSKDDLARRTAARRDLARLHDAALRFMARSNGRVPTVGQLVAPDREGHAYLPLPAGPLRDPWGNDFEIRRDPHDPQRPLVVCRGPDGRLGTGDDLTSRDPHGR